MTEPSASRAPVRRRAAVVAVFRFLATFSVVIAAYFVLPFDSKSLGADLVGRLALALVFLIVIVIWEVRQIQQARHPTLRAMEALGVALPFFLCTYAATYLVLSVGAPASFTEPLSHTAALYFTIVVFGTVGFGDIAPVSAFARMLVSSQVLINLVFIALVVRTLFAASRRTRSAKSASPRDD